MTSLPGGFGREEPNAATKPRLVQFLAELKVETTGDANEAVQAVQDAIGHTGVIVLDITYIEGATP